MKYIKTFENIKYDELKVIKKFLETKWGNDSLKQCIRGTYFLKELLGGEINGGWVSSNPSPDEVGGFKDRNGKWNFHYWLLKDNKIIDITSDQFGEKPINVLSGDDERYVNNADEYNKTHDFRYTPDIVDVWITEYKSHQ